MRTYLGEIRCRKPIQYIRWYWMDYINALLDRNNIDMCMDSPRMLLREILSEIQYNKFKNADNIKMFQTKLSEWEKKDAVFKKLVGGDVRIAVKKYFTENQKSILQEMCVKVLAKLDELHYADELIDYLIGYIEDIQLNINDDTKSEIRKYTELIITEFVSHGHHLHDILGLTEEISEHEKSHGKKNAMLESIREVYNRDPQDAYLIMSLSHIKGVSEVCIDDVTIYSPKIRKFIDEVYENSIEKETQYQNLCAAIPVKCLGLYSAIEYAQKKMDGILEILSIYYDIEKGIEYDLGHYCLVRNRVVIGEHLSNSAKGRNSENDFYKMASAIDVDALKVNQEDLSTLYQQLNALSDKSTTDRLKNALHWCRKANAAYSYEEQLLHSWFALEGLFAVPDEVKECLAPKTKGKIEEMKTIIVDLLGPNIFRNKCYHVYYEMQWRVHTLKRMTLAEDLMNRAGLDILPGQAYRPDDFIRCAKELSENVEDELLKDKLTEVSQFYKSLSNYDCEIQRLSNNIQNIYRYRNLIVHNAVIPAFNVQYYSMMAYVICREIISALLKRCTKDDITIEEALLHIVLNYEHFYDKLPEILGKINNNK